MLNVLINGFHLQIGRRVIERGFTNIPIRRCVLISSSEQDPILNTVEPIIRNSCRLQDVDWECVAPLDEEVIEALRPCESIFLEMLNRKEGKGRIISYAERKRAYLQTVRYWNHYLNEQEINLFISVCLPHRIRTHVIYSLCKYKNIPVLFFHHTSPIPSMFYIGQDWKESIINLRERFAELKKNPSEQNYILPEPVLTYYLKQTERTEDPTPWFVRKKPKTPVKDWLYMVICIARKSIRDFSLHIFRNMRKKCTLQFWFRYFNNHKRYIEARALFRFYDDHASNPDLSKRYIYVPLQVQPEVTTCPMAGAYSDQFLIVQLLGKLLPDDVLIYVKEHPNQQYNFPDGRCRSIDFYKDMFSIPAVRFIPRTFDTYSLMENSLAVASATGSAGFEGLFRGKPFLIFGYDYYQYAPSVFMIRSIDDCKRALHDILQDGIKPTLSEMKLFLKALSDVTVPGYLSEELKQVAIVDDDACVENLGSLLERRILNLKICDS